MLTFLLLALIDGKPVPELAPPPVPDVPGLYSFQTTLPSGKDVDGYCVVSANKDVAGGFIFEWLYPGVGRVVGIGIREGNTIWVSWRDAQSFGLCRYRIEIANGKPALVGDRGGAETLHFVR